MLPSPQQRKQIAYFDRGATSKSTVRATGHVPAAKGAAAEAGRDGLIPSELGRSGIRCGLSHGTPM